MNLSKTAIGELYQSLSSSDVKKLTKYIQQRYESPEYRVSKLHRAIVQIIQSKKQSEIDSNWLKKTVFKKDKMSNSNWTSQMNILINIVKEFILLKLVKKKNIYVETLWGEYLIENGLKKNLIVKSANFKIDPKNDDYPLFKKYMMDREKLYLNEMLYAKRNKKQYEDTLLTLLSFQDFVVDRKIDIYNSILSYVMYDELSENHYLEIQNLLKYGEKSDIDLLQLKTFNLSLVVNKNFESFIKLKSKFDQNFDKISKASAVETSFVLINFGLKQLDDGVLEYLEGTIEVFEILITKNIFFSKFYFNHTIFNRYITLKLRVSEKSDEVKEIIHEKIDLLPLNQKESCLHLNMAKIYFKDKQYKDSIRSLGQINVSKSILYLPLTKVLLLKNLVEIEDEERVKAERENLYKYFFYSKSLSSEAKNRYKLFHANIGDLLMIRFEQLSRYKRAKLSKAISNDSPYFIEKDWMQERLQFLEGRFPLKAKKWK